MAVAIARPWNKYLVNTALTALSRDSHITSLDYTGN